MPPKRAAAQKVEKAPKIKPGEKLMNYMKEELSKEYETLYGEAMTREKLKGYYDASAVIGETVDDLIEGPVKTGIKDSVVR